MGLLSLNKKVSLWISDKQDAFVTGIAAEFPEVPHRYCDNHFLRDVAKPVLEADSHAKVQMRRQGGGLADGRTSRAQASEDLEASKELAGDDPEATMTVIVGPADPPPPPADSAAAVVLEDCAAVRGILNDDQGGPLHPPGLRMADALEEVRESIQRNLDAKRGGSQKSNSAVWPPASTGDSRTSKPSKGRSESTSRTSTRWPRPSNLEGKLQRSPKAKFKKLIDRFKSGDGDPIRQHMATLMISFLAGLFVGEGKSEEIKENPP